MHVTVAAHHRIRGEGQERIRAMSPMAEMFSVRRIRARASCDVVCAFRPLLFRIAPELAMTPHDAA